MILTDKLFTVAYQKSKELGIDISIAISNENGLPRVYRDTLVLSIAIVPGKAYTSAITQCKTKDVAEYSKKGASLRAIQTNEPRITLVAVGGTEHQDCGITEYVVSVLK